MLFLLHFFIQLSFSRESTTPVPFSSANNSLQLRKVATVNCGGPRHVGYGGLVYDAELPTNGVTDINLGEKLNKTFEFSNAKEEDRELFRTERYSHATFGYSFPLPADGNFVLILKFSEVWKNAPGARMFHVMLNSLVLLKNLDIFQRTGKQGLAYERRFPFAMKEGKIRIWDQEKYIGSQLQVTFHKGLVGDPQISAIALLTGDLRGLPPVPETFDPKMFNYSGYEMIHDAGQIFLTPRQCCQLCDRQGKTLHPFNFNPDTLRCSEYFEDEFVYLTDGPRVSGHSPEECCHFCGEALGESFYEQNKEEDRPGLCRMYPKSESGQTQCDLCQGLVELLLDMENVTDVDVIKAELLNSCEQGETRTNLCKELIEDHGDALIITANSNISSEAICTHVVRMCDKSVEYPVVGLVVRHDYSILPADIQVSNSSDLFFLPSLTTQNIGQYIGDETQDGRRDTLKFLARYGLIRNRMKCPDWDCSQDMTLVEGDHEHRWRCEGCRRPDGGSSKLSVRLGSIFEENNLKLGETVKVMASWAEKAGVLPNDLPSTSIWYNILRDVCEAWFVRMATTGKLGGENKTVEVGEVVTYGSKYRDRKSNRTGRKMLAAFERGSQKMTLVHLKSSLPDALIAALQECVQPGTLLVSDIWDSYGGAEYLQPSFAGYWHKLDGISETVFVNSTDTRAYDKKYPPLTSSVRNENSSAPSNPFQHWFIRYHGNKKIMNQLLREITEQYNP